MRSSLRDDLTGRFRGAGKEPASETPASGDEHDSLGDAAWPSQVHARSVRLRPLTALLTVALVALVGIWGGAELQKRHGTGSTSSGTSGLAAAFASRFGNRTGGTGGTGGFGGFGGGGAAAGGTSGTVTEVTPKLLYLTSSTGALVKIGLTAATTYTRTAKSPKGGLQVGDTAIVIGSKNAKGLVVATSVIATQKGVTATTGRGFAGGGLAGGAGAGGGASAGG